VLWNIRASFIDVAEPRVSRFNTPQSHPESSLGRLVVPQADSVHNLSSPFSGMPSSSLRIDDLNLFVDLRGYPEGLSRDQIT
jgi:hypothetical protein